jgi:sodium/bile acid cotransporter 7
MRSFLSRHWFLLLLFLGIAVAGFAPEQIRPVTEKLQPRLVVGLALFLISWSLESRSLFQAASRPQPALYAVLVSYLFLPALAWCSGLLLSQPDLRLGLMISTVVPCTLASAVIWTRMAGGTDAIALVVVVVTTATSWLVAPAWLGAWTREMASSIESRNMMMELALVLILPVGLGQLCRAARPLTWFANRWKTFIGVLAQFLILSIMVKAAVNVRDRLEDEALPSLWAILVAVGLCVGNHLAAFAAGYFGGKALGFGRPNAIAVGFSCSQKTLPVALFLFDRYFRHAYPLALLPLAFYHLGQLLVDTLIANRLKPH